MSKDVERGVTAGSSLTDAPDLGVLPRADELELGRDALRTTGSGENTVSRDRGRDPDDAGRTLGSIVPLANGSTLEVYNRFGLERSWSFSDIVFSVMSGDF